MGLHNKIDFLASISPVVQLALTGRRGIGQMGTDRLFDEPSAKFPVRAAIRRADAGCYGHRRGIHDL